MAVENVKKFFELVKSDEKLSREIAKIKDEIQNKGETVDYEQIISKKVIPMAKKHGLDFTMEDFLKYTNSVVQQGELSDDNLLNVSGGMNLRQGLATGFLLLSVGTTGLGLMANNIVGNGGGSSTGGQEPASTPTTYSQSIGNGIEGEEVVDTENDEIEDNEFNDEDDAVPATEGVSMGMLGAGMFDASEDEVDTQGGAGESASTNKNVAGSGAADVGATSSASTNKNVAGGGVAGGAAKSTTATKTTAGGGAGAGGAAGATTATKKDEAKKDEAAKSGAEAAKKDEAKKDEAAKKDETKEEAKTETEKKSEAAKTEATEKQEYKKFGDWLWHASTWGTIGKHIYGEMEKVGFKIDNFSNKEGALSDIKAYVEGAETKFKEGSEEKKQYDKIKTSYDNYTTEVAKKAAEEKAAAEEAAKKAAEEEAAKKAAEEAAKKAANEKKKDEALKTKEAQEKINDRKNKNKNLVLDVGSIFEDAEKEAEEEEKKAEEAFKTGKWDYTPISVKESDTGENMTLKEKIDHIYNFGKNFESISQVTNRGDLGQDAENVVDLAKNADRGTIDSEDLIKINKIVNLRDEFNKKAEVEKEDAARKAAMEKEIENLEWDIENLSDEGTDEKMNVVERLMKVWLDSEGGKNVSEDSKAKLESEVLKLGLILYNPENKNFDIGRSYPNGSSFVALYKEESKGLPTYNKFVGKSDEDKANYIVQNLEKFGDDYRMNYESKGELVSDLKDLKDKIVKVGADYKLQITTNVLWGFVGTRTEMSDKVSSESLKKILRACNELGV